MHDIGVVVALPGEAATLKRPGAPWQVVVSGMGRVRAARAAEQLREQGATALVSWGVAGGLNPALHGGDLVLADRIDSDAGEEPVNPAWVRSLHEVAEGLGLHSGHGRLWTHPHPVMTVAEKQQLARRHHDMVDMEAAAVARSARMAGIPFVAIKCIADPAWRALPELAIRLLRPDGTLRWTGVLGALTRGPRAWNDLRTMHGDWHAACSGLRQFAAAWEGCHECEK